jgi:predicted nucleic acid-binding protein
MNGVFVDTSGWYAMIDRKDNSHPTAHDFIQKNRLPLVTTDYVMDETATLLLIQLGHGYAVRFFDSLQTSRMVQLVYLKPAQIEATMDLFRNRPDKGWSFTDCSSFVLMREYGLQRALAFDEHFRQAGFLVESF